MYKALICAAVFSSLFSASANSELLWSDGCDVRQRFQTFIRKRIPQNCSWPKSPVDVQGRCSNLNTDGLFGYQDLRRHSDRPPIIAYEAVVHVNKTCFSQLTSRVRAVVKSKGSIISNRNASDLFSQYNADGGPTFIFYFPATVDELNEVDRVTYGR
jgi:hypothetical protein